MRMASQFGILGLMRTTVDIPEPLLQNAKRRASERGLTLSALLEDALRSHLSAKLESPEPFHLHTVRGRLVSPSLDLDRTSALLLQDDESEFGSRNS
jgi:hypothetical protein